MTMEKYGVSNRTLLDGLRDEEHRLMLKLMEANAPMEKSAEELSDIEKRLGHIRAKITEMDLKPSS